MISLLTPTRSEVDHAKMSLFFSRKAKSSACSSRHVSVPRQIAMLGTLGSSATFLKSPLDSIAFLNSVGASGLVGHSDC
jgi:hypothetical protein